MAIELKAFTSAVSTFVQEVVTTPTPKVLFDTFFNTLRGYKPLRNAICFTSTMAGSAGGVALCICVPEIYAYCAPIVIDTLPFIGAVGEGIGVGMIGFWIGGAVVYTFSKYGYREAARLIGGHPNSAYHFDEKDVERMIDANPVFYPNVSKKVANEESQAQSRWQKFRARHQQRWSQMRAWWNSTEDAQTDLESQTPPVDPGFIHRQTNRLRALRDWWRATPPQQVDENKRFHIEALMNSLIALRSKIDLYKWHKNRKGEHDVCKYALESALRRNDLAQLQELEMKNALFKLIRVVTGGLQVAHISDADANDFIGSGSGDIENIQIKDDAPIYSACKKRARELNNPSVGGQPQKRRKQTPHMLDFKAKKSLLPLLHTVKTQQLGKLAVHLEHIPGETDVLTELFEGVRNRFRLG